MSYHTITKLNGCGFKVKLEETFSNLHLYGSRSTRTAYFYKILEANGAVKNGTDIFYGAMDIKIDPVLSAAERLARSDLDTKINCYKHSVEKFFQC